MHSVAFTGDGADIAYWNRYVAVTQIGGLGTFEGSRLAAGASPTARSTS